MEMNTQSNNSIQMTVGSQTKRLRKEAGMTQDTLAEKCEIYRTYLSRIEGGMANPTILVIEALAKALGVEPWELLRAETTPVT